MTTRPAGCYTGEVERVVQIFDSFEEAEQADRAYYRSLSPQQRLEILFELISRYRGSDSADQQRLARVHRVIELA
jgi:hypothetical protein